MKPSKNTAKKTLYIDVDDEITAVIDKVLATKEQIVAVVVPKRATVFSSVVNLKLLKRSAAQNDKKLVLVTSNKSVLPIAGIAGLHVASNLNSKPYLPSKPVKLNAEADSDSAVEVDNTAPLTTNQSVDETTEDEPESVEVDNTPKTVADKKATKSKKIKKPKLKVPNFNKFRVGLGLVILGVIALVSFIYWAVSVAPKATVTVRGDNVTKDLSLAIQANTSVEQSDIENKIIASTKKELPKTETQTVPATGKKDKGNKASGTVTLQNCSKSDGSVDIPAGTGVSNGGLTYITQSSVHLSPSSFSGGSGTCTSSTKDVDVIAQQGGDKYNVKPQDYTVAGFSGVEATGSEMKGGTSDIVTVVSQSDIETAKSKIGDNKAAVTEELKNTLKAEGYVPLVDTLDIKDGDAVVNPAVDTETSNVTVSIKRNYSMTGVKQADLEELIKKQAFDSGIDQSQQSILTTGLDNATFQLGAINGAVTIVNISTKVVAGPEIDAESLKQEIAGMKSGEAEQLILSRPGIIEAHAETSPFWNSKIPKNTKKINLIIQDTPDAGSDQQP